MTPEWERDAIEWEDGWARQAAAVEQDTGLDAHHQALRELRARTWASRVLVLMTVAGCDAGLAIRAIEASNKELTHGH